MEGFLRRLQTVADVAEDTASSVGDIEKEELNDMPTDTDELQHRLRQALSRLKSASARWEELHGESCKLETELATLRQRFTTSREVWLLVHQFDQTTIESLLQERRHAKGEDRSTALEGVGGGPCPNDGGGNLRCDPTYVSSLQEQSATLKELLRKYAEERDKYKLEVDKLRSAKNGQTVCYGDGSGNASARKFASSSMQDRTLQDHVDQLEAELRRQAEAMSEMVTPGRLHRNAWNNTKYKSDVQLRRIHLLERELAALRQETDGDGGDAKTGVVDSPKSVGHEGTETSCESAVPPGRKKTDVDEKDVAGLNPATDAVKDLLRRLEGTQAENLAREEALNAMYQDVHSLRERNAQLDQQLVVVDEQLDQMGREMVFAQDQYKIEQDRNRELLEQLEITQQQLQKRGRELANANEEIRRLRLQTTSSTTATRIVHAFPSTEALLKGPAHTALGGGSWGSSVDDNVRAGKQVGAAAGLPLQDVGRAPWGVVKTSSGWFNRHYTFFGLLREIGRRRLIIVLFVILVMIMTALMQSSLGTFEPDATLSKLRDDLLTCQSQLRVKFPPQDKGVG
ncbi:hypothetical protein TraAM80_00875 [Trypanosoma rangeli]|uniref:Uncharacterized protein n=1 Tax=Trypanosoma rangeli TaxID=5698 RepID=A0A3S5ISI9_TRYRA|nr:uncharacterized protein TraAM80_00875 [Trypanosoma rangeli]RNF11542.1 hypothetical protein TraAM80_00875 [Trypanosoma rangeli]|eukprot:RNF11542.1 hypothetical protein TraAM80_00875 [Trypanosoma rangeli]